MSVKWHNKRSTTRELKGGGPQGASLGLLEFLSHFNDGANCVPQEERFKFLDDLSILKLIYLISIGLTSYNALLQVPSDIPPNIDYIPPENLKSQKYLDEINEWS